MRDWYEFNKKTIMSIIERPIEAITGFLFIALVFFILYFSLWVFYPQLTLTVPEVRPKAAITLTV